MANVISNDDGQLMLLTVFLIAIGVVSFTALLNSMVFSANMPSTGLDSSKQDIRDLRSLTESEIKTAAFYSNISVADPTNETQVRAYFLNYIKAFNDTIKKSYSVRGASAEIVMNNVTFNKTTSSLSVLAYFVDRRNHTFPNGSLVIPMDGNQTNIMKVYGLIYKTVDGSGTSGLNSTSIPVWNILQNPVNSSVPDFYSTMDTKNITGDGTVQSRNYSGGPFIIDAGDIDATKKQMILAEAANKSITVHELVNQFYYTYCVKLVVPPRVAVYPKGDSYTRDVMEPYYRDGEVPYTELDNTDILNGNLSNYDILTIPHHDMYDEPANVITAIVGWVANGGILHAECMATDTMDRAVETRAGGAKPWYGFIGISGSGNDLPSGATYMKLLDNNTNGSYFNKSPPMTLPGLADPGAPYSPLTQTSNISGILGPESGATEAFSLRDNSSQVNPATNILGHASWGNGTSIYNDYDSDGTKEPQLIYVEAPYDNGLVVYIAGHNLTKRTGSAERFIFESFFAASMKQEAVTVVSAKNLNVTIRYDNGKVKYEDTFLINT
ncbi:MAG: hypothetical protein OIN66_04430 [Candidatus Methanoperedens sp.]|nr:hypothetical protein [Candidatus Methanoperedens sp.]